jgi:hypothetical protein
MRGPTIVLCLRFLSRRFQHGVSRVFHANFPTADTVFMANMTVNRYSLSRKRARKFVASVCNRARKMWSDAFDVVVLATFGNYGNISSYS